MARGQIYHAPLDAASASEWEPLDLRGAIVFGRDAREHEIQGDTSSGGSSRDSLMSAETSGSSDSSRSFGIIDAVNEESGSMPLIREANGVLDLAGSLGAKDDDMWFRLVEIDPGQKKRSKVVWRQPVLPTSSDYRVFVPLFHAFSGNSRLFGFKFDDDDEAHQFSECVFVHTRASPLVKPTSVPSPWSKNARRRKTKIFVPTIKQVPDPEQTSLQRKADVGVDDKGGAVTQVSRKVSISSGEPVRQRPRRTSTVLGSRRLKRYLRD